jgi:ketopantoate reductase
LIILSVFEGFRVLENQLVMTPTAMGWKVEHTKEGRRVSTLLLDAGIICKAEPHLDLLRAEKTIVNCCLNALSTIEKKPFDVMFSTESIRKRIDPLFDECYTIVCKEYQLEAPENEKIMDEFRELI